MEISKWILDNIKVAIHHQCPVGYEVNEKTCTPIATRLIVTGGVCPCHHSEWTDDTPDEDKLCPCKTFRDSGECHCGLYEPKQ